MITIGAVSRCWFNLHLKTNSVGDRAGKVLGNFEYATLAGGVVFRVSEKMRRKCVANKRRKVHAYALGTLESVEPVDVSTMTPLTYNPYRAGHFHVQGDPSAAVERAERVVFVGGYCYAEGAVIERHGDERHPDYCPACRADELADEQ